MRLPHDLTDFTEKRLVDLSQLHRIAGANPTTDLANQRLTRIGGHGEVQLLDRSRSVAAQPVDGADLHERVPVRRVTFQRPLERAPYAPLVVHRRSDRAR